MLAAALAGALLYPLISRSAPATGARAPDFDLKDVCGHNLGLSEYRGDTVVISLLVDRDGRVRGAWAGDTNPMPGLARQIKELQSQ
jgi:peroxiredoxin